MDQALGILYWHKHNIADAKKTMSKLASITGSYFDKFIFFLQYFYKSANNLLFTKKKVFLWIKSLSLQNNGLKKRKTFLDRLLKQMENSFIKLKNL